MELRPYPIRVKYDVKTGHIEKTDLTDAGTFTLDLLELFLKSEYTFKAGVSLTRAPDDRIVTLGKSDKKRKMKDDAVVYGGHAYINDYKPDEVNGTARQKKKKSTADMAYMHLLR